MSKSLQEIYLELGITSEHLTATKLSWSEQPPLKDLEVVDIDYEGKPFILVSSAAQAWRKMQLAAQDDGISLMAFSGFRSYLHQKRLIEYQLKQDRKIEDILTHIAIPGYSEHHTGRAVDIYANDRPVLEEAFEQTTAFGWLTKNAGRFHFTLSYPRQNKYGIIYEPWHWCFSLY